MVEKRKVEAIPLPEWESFDAGKCEGENDFPAGPYFRMVAKLYGKHIDVSDSLTFAKFWVGNYIQTIYQEKRTRDSHATKPTAEHKHHTEFPHIKDNAASSSSSLIVSKIDSYLTTSFPMPDDANRLSFSKTPNPNTQKKRASPARPSSKHLPQSHEINPASSKHLPQRHENILPSSKLLPQSHENSQLPLNHQKPCQAILSESKNLKDNVASKSVLPIPQLYGAVPSQRVAHDLSAGVSLPQKSNDWVSKIEHVKELAAKVTAQLTAKSTGDLPVKITAELAPNRTGDLPTVESDAKRTRELPVKNIAELGAKRTSELPVKNTAESTSKRTSELPIKHTAEPAAKRTAEMPSKQTVEASAKRTSKQTVESAAKHTSKQSVESSSKRTPDLPSKQTVESAAKRPTDLRAKHTVESTAKSSTDLRAKQSVESAAKSSTDLRAKHIAESTAKSKTDLHAKHTIRSSPKLAADLPAQHTVQSVGKARADSLSPAGVIFMCTNRTKPICFRYGVFGLPLAQLKLVERIMPGTKLFLFGIDSRELSGVFEATSNGGYNLEPEAFGFSFPSQVRFKWAHSCQPVPERIFKDAIKDNYFAYNKFNSELNSDQVTKLLKLYSVENVPGKETKDTNRKADDVLNSQKKDSCVPVLDSADAQSELSMEISSPQPQGPSFPAVQPQGPSFPTIQPNQQASITKSNINTLPTSTNPTSGYSASVENIWQNRLQDSMVGSIHAQDRSRLYGSIPNNNGNFYNQPYLASYGGIPTSTIGSHSQQLINGFCMQPASMVTKTEVEYNAMISKLDDLNRQKHVKNPENPVALNLWKESDGNNSSSLKRGADLLEDSVPYSHSSKRMNYYG